MHALGEFEQLFKAGTEEEWARELAVNCARYGFERVVFALVPNVEAGINHGYLQTTYPSRWRNLYDKEGLALIDPTVIHCRKQSVPLVWAPEIFSSKPQKALYEEASSYGLRTGVTLPIHGPSGVAGMLSLASDRCATNCTLRDVAHFLPELSLMRDVAFERGKLFFEKQLEAKRVPLTQREHECLKWLVAGKSSWDIAHILKISVATVDFHIKNIRAKLDASSRRLVVVKAIQLGLVNLD